ncbi:MAG: NAD(P)-dependent oxidoreductase [Cytophagaceae bacterium]|nr:NAD(P)-dependent oxidoreductase [Cytophagaceae bacterium]
MSTNIHNTKKAIVFGANGYLGRHLVHFLKGQNIDVLPVDIKEDSIDGLENYKSIDVTEKSSLVELDWNQDYIFIFSGKTGTMVSIHNYEDFVSINEIGLLNILEQIKSLENKPKIIFPSTRLVYKGADSPIAEDGEKETKTIYAVNKLACESILTVYSNLYGIPYTVFRVCIPYGTQIKDGYSYGTIGFFLKEAKHLNPIRLYGDGALKRTFTHVEDICNQIISSLNNEKSINQIYNIKGETFSLYEVATMIAEKYGSSVSFTDWPENDLKIESGHTVFDGSKIEKDFGITLINSFKNWLANNL